MNKQKVEQKTVSNDPNKRVKLLLVLLLVLAGSIIFLKTSTSERLLGIKLSGLISSADYQKGKDVSKGEPDFQGGPVSGCANTSCLDKRIQIIKPTENNVIGPRKTHKIEWREDESIESRYHEISIQPMNCGDACPAPYIIASRYKGAISYNWTIGSFLPVPSYLQNTPVWLRVSTQGRFNSAGLQENYYNQIPVKISSTGR